MRCVLRAYSERLREILPPRTPIIRLSERRFALLVDCDSMSKVMDIAVMLTEDNPPQLEVGGDRSLVDVTLGIAVFPFARRRCRDAVSPRRARAEGSA